MSDGVVGRCMEMCPLEEIRFRKRNNLIHALEKDGVFVKEYTRSAAGSNHLKPDLLRPPPVLHKTVDYLIGMFRDDIHPFSLIYSFVSDRLRAVRQDMTLQRLAGVEAVSLFERMIEFYTLSEYRCRLEQTKSFEWKMHATAVEECYSRWKELLRLDSDPETVGPLRAHVAASYALRQAREAEALLVYFDVRPLMDGVLRKLVFDLILAIKEGNFVRVFRLLRALPSPFIRLSTLSLLGDIRRSSLRVLSLGYKSPPVKITSDKVVAWLGFDSSEDLFNCIGDLGDRPEGDFVFPSKIGNKSVDLSGPQWLRMDSVVFS